jgi:hypothetical protein
MISVISDWVLATVRTIGFSAGWFIVLLLHSLRARRGPPLSGYNGESRRPEFRSGSQFQFQPSPPISQILHGRKSTRRPDSSKMDKLAGLKEILAMDPANSFARYGFAMELASRGETDSALAEFSTLVNNDPNYTAGYFMAAQTLASAGRTKEAIERLKAGIDSARRTGNNHALSEMQAMLDELDR